MKPSLYLINPRTDYPAYYGTEVFGDLGLSPTAFVADLAVVRALARLGKDEAGMLSRLSLAVRGRPETQRHVFADLFRYMQIRSIYWEKS